MPSSTGHMASRFSASRSAPSCGIGRAGRYRPCTDEERWAKPDEWAVRKRGVTRALPHGAHLADLRSAEAFAESQRHKFAVEIDHRPGGNPRCEAYCRGARWCEQAKALGVVKAEG